MRCQRGGFGARRELSAVYRNFGRIENCERIIREIEPFKFYRRINFKVLREVKKMFCPNCGANNSTEQKFCRACGLNLEQTALSLLEQIPSAESLKLLRRERNLEKFGNIVFTGFGLVLLTGIGAIIYLIITTIIMNGNVLGGVLIIAFLVFAALALTYVALNEDLKERKQKASPALKN